MSKAILFTGSFQYGVVADFIQGIAQSLHHQGYQVQQINLSEKSSLQQQLTAETFRGTELVFSVNALGADLLPYFAELRQVPFYSLLLDHPLHSLLRFFGTPLRLLCVDQAHVAFARAVGMQAEFCPHAISAAQVSLTASPDTAKQGILFPASFFSADKAKTIIDQHFPQAWNWLRNPAVRTISDFLYQLGFMQAGKKPLLELNKNTITILCHCDFYLRAIGRDRLLQQFADAGLALQVIGNGWEQAQQLPQHQYLPAVAFPALLQMMQKVRYVLHHSPGFEAGLHERLLYPIGAGTQVLSEPTPYLEQVFTRGGAVRFFNHAAELSPALATVSAADYQSQLVHSQQLLKQQHSWDVRLQPWLLPQKPQTI
jgi:hypothetical protein